MSDKKVRVYELAKELGVTSQVLMVILKDLGESVKSYLSTIEQETSEAVQEIVQSQNEERKRKKQEEALKKGIPIVVTEQVSHKERKESDHEEQKPKEDLVYFNADQLCRLIHIDYPELQTRLLKYGIVSYSPQDSIPGFAVKSLCEIYEIPLEFNVDDKIDDRFFKMRAPVITIMGHVDHGKTTLLDYIRKTRVADKELGGITQAIGAYSVLCHDKPIIFIDTPGHEAFTAMRAKGSEITDIVVLIVAAEDGVKETTLEAIDHAKAAKVPIIVAINKIDLDNANIERVKTQLADRGLNPEEWGGDTIVVPISAKKGIGVDDLLEMILLKAEMIELHTSTLADFAGTVIESNITKTFGSQATIIVQTGTLRRGDVVTVDGKTEYKIRVLNDDLGVTIKKASALTPVNVKGLPEILKPGSIARSAKNYVPYQASVLHEKPEEITSQEEEVDWAEDFLSEKEIVERFNIIIKADGEGTLDALQVALEKMKVEGVELNIIRQGVGIITEDDILLASVSKAHIFGFNSTASPGARAEAKNKSIRLKTYRIIFELLDDIKAGMKGVLTPEETEEVLGTAEVKQVFKVPRAGSIAGCIVRSGIIRRNAKARIIRDRSILFESKVSSLKRFKEDAKEVREGFECGIGVENFNDIKAGDTIEVFQMVEKPQ
ncbi:MAG: translation initiation factor IF-2 [Caldisericia bacterium]|nr:translation initiation factor IF-2 [Caldisericia bacterium]